MASRVPQGQIQSTGYMRRPDRDVENPLPTSYPDGNLLGAPWNWNRQSASEAIHTISPNIGRTSGSSGVILSPDRLMASGFNYQGDEYFSRSTIEMSSKLPSWLWMLLSYSLGISPCGTSPSRCQLCLSTTLHVLTLAAGLCFGGCGLLFNIYDTLSESTETNAVVCIVKTVLGLFWILLGAYSHSLAARLFGSRFLLEYIRLHSKTFMKISTIVWITFMGITVLASNMYSSRYMLETDFNNNSTKIVDATCASVGLDLILCQIYFGSKVMFSCFVLIWNLIVVAVCLSVCRTHTVCIRRFMKELSYDSKIYEEFYALKTNNPSLPQTMLQSQISEYDYCNEFMVNEEEEDYTDAVPSNRENILQRLRFMRYKQISESSASHIDTQETDKSNLHRISEGLHNSENRDEAVFREVEMKACAEEVNFNDTLDSSGVFEPTFDDERRTSLPDFSNMSKPPIMSNEDLMFTYFKLMKHLRTSSRLLQRWMSIWFAFILLWCEMLIIYWISHTAQLIGIFQFAVPLMILILLTSAYSEVNFEGQRVPRSILPTEERMSVIYYVNNAPLLLKVYSMVMTYNVLVTVLMGAVATLGTRLLLDNFF